MYWIAQNEQDHRTPDWKLHFSVKPAHVPKAWDVLSALFMELDCDFGMKAVSGDALESWPQKQFGRELTVYMFQHSATYGWGGPMTGLCEDCQLHNFWLGPEFERDSGFWHQFVQAAEEAFQKAGVESHGLADGDLKLGRYASLRNEAFIPVDGLHVYPPNNAGWNAAGHACPLQLPRIQLMRNSLRQLRRLGGCQSRRSQL